MSDSADAVMHESRVFQPPKASEVGGPPWHVASLDEYRKIHERSIADPEGFWGEIAKEFHWFTPFGKVLEWNLPDAKWFVGGTTNLCYNAVDRQVDQGHGGSPAIIWESEPIGEAGPEVLTLTYKDLQEQTSRCANALRAMGVKKGDVVTIYMGMVPELAVACLACVRIGAVHSVIFGGFSSSAIVDRVTDAKSRVIVTCDGSWRRGSIVPLKDNVDAACAQLTDTPDAVQHVLVVRRCGNDITWNSMTDAWWHDAVDAASPACPCEPLDAEHMAFLLYTSGSTGKPKGIVHTTGGYMVFTALTSKYTFNLVPDQGQVYWCTADIGWITGHSYILYGILPNRVPSLMYEGAPNHPEPDRFWDIVDRH